MNYFLLAAGSLSIVIGLIHSALGERLIFKSLRQGKIVPDASLSPLREQHIGILWATWHLASILGFGIGATLIYIADTSEPIIFIVNVIGVTMLLSSTLVFIATKAQHPGWFGLLVVALLCWFA